MTDLNPITNRRRFVKQTGLAAGALALSQPFTVLGQAAPKKLKVGIVGCGGRGKIVSEMALKDGRYEIVSLADYFKDQADTLGEKFNVPSERRFTGLDCYKRLIDAGGIDIIAILSPPYFHPDQVEAAVEAGLHVWLAKPIAIDTPSVKRVVVAAQKAASQKRCFLVDFQTRSLDSFHEAARRVAAGDLGTLGYAEIEATSLAFKLKAPDTGYESRLRNWLQWKDLCGENVVEFSIHAIDMASLNSSASPPVSATGFCERQFVDHTPETHPGDVRDVCNVVYDYGDGFKCVLRAKRFDHHKISGGIEVRPLRHQRRLSSPAIRAKSISREKSPSAATGIWARKYAGSITSASLITGRPSTKTSPKKITHRPPSSRVPTLITWPSWPGKRPTSKASPSPGTKLPKVKRPPSLIPAS
jgi:myo-inositol 2-dehydrogenase/D-chiro-inositol 1-dehydrogenase